jgi:signal transduction histidine kinase
MDPSLQDPPWWKFWRPKPLKPWMMRMTTGLTAADVDEIKLEQIQAQHRYAHVQTLCSVASLVVALAALVVAALS